MTANNTLTRGFPGITWVRSLGYHQAEPPMQSEINTWWSWYRADGDFYSCEEVSALGATPVTFKVERISFNPAKMVCEDWASLLFNYRTGIGLEGVTDLDDGVIPDDTLQKAYNWIAQWVKDTCLFSRATSWERCFALGTYGFALGLDNLREDGVASPETHVSLHRFDARSIVPLAWDEDRCTEAAFISSITYKGSSYTQWVVHTLDDIGRCVIRTAHFKGNGQRIELPGFAAEVHTGIADPLFRLVSPEVDNTHLDSAPFGASIFDGAIGALKLADGALDNAWKDLYLGQKMMFIPESMLQVTDDGSIVVPRAANQQLFMAKPDSGLGDSSGNKIDEYNPDLRTEDNRRAIDTALALLGKRCGFGMGYYRLDDAGQPKTAKEVGAANADLMRSAKKHEQAIGRQISGLCEVAVLMANRFACAGLPDITGKVCVLFGDTIVQDEDTEREGMRADVAAGLVPAWKYVERYYGVSPDTAKQWTGEEVEVNPEPMPEDVSIEA